MGLLLIPRTLPFFGRQTYINNQNPIATVGDVLGTSSIKTIVRESLAASLPYELRTRKLVASSLTDSQRWKFKYSLGTTQHGQVTDTLININQPTALLAGKKLAVSFAPASEADEQLIASYLPKPDANGEIDPSKIPNTLPGYLINLKAEFALGNDTIATSNNSITMGTELLEEMGYWQPNRGWNTSRNKPVAGEYRAIALDLHGISASQAEQLKNDMESTQQKINAEDYTNLGKQQLVGDLLYATILSYFALNNVQDDISARQANMVTYKAPSYGLFKTNVAPVYWFGIPRNVKISGLTMDVDRITHLLAHKDNTHEQWVNYNRASGARLSAMEHLVPEQMFSTEENPAHGISAVKAIQLAAAEGQKIWTITQKNLNIALNSLKLDNDIKNDIRNAVNAGQEVTTHEKYINFHGKSAAGYIMLNPATGAGAYMISSGENGGDIFSFSSDFINIAALLSEGVGRLTQSNFLYGLGKIALGPIASAVQLLANVFNVLESCLQSNASSAQTLVTMLISISLTMLFVFTIAQIGFVLPGIGNLFAWIIVEGIKLAISDAIASVRC